MPTFDQHLVTLIRDDVITLAQAMDVSSSPHLAASPVGATLTVEAVMRERTGRRVNFTAQLTAGERALATAEIVRVVVDRAAFEAAAR